MKALRAAGGDPSGWTIPPWTLEKDLQFNTSQQIQTTILSLTAPGATIASGADAITLAREINDSAAQIRDSNPHRYGFFAALPSILDTDAAIAEIDRALDELGADGVTLFTRYGADNHYLGHSDFEKIWMHLDAKGAVVFVHPTHAVDTRLVNANLPQPMIDYPHETTRAAVDIVMAGIMRRYRQCKIILSHAGGTLPYLAVRPAAMLPYTPVDIGKSTEEFVEDAREFYFDVALSGNEYSLACLRAFAKEGHVLFGSDYPYAPEEAIGLMTRGLDGCMLEGEREAWNWGNAEKLLPRLGARRKEKTGLKSSCTCCKR